LIIFDASALVSAALKADSVPERALLRVEAVDVFALSAEVDAEIAGVLGRPKFAGTRLAVRHIGGTRIKGEPVERIIEDYPYLSPQEIGFAVLYTQANPLVGRPKTVGSGARA
jgi:uncharacterized protein (DUF433 family)